ncbi:Metallo-dependent hydrolase [Mycena venus]|uniref:6-methylsalicylate decarboxylase n=1 Tax=Mycena venus TaxID=2733690 RepID=A0A8H6YER2_9AGAR|nr:Metallo-dependent hydrolase [Mycena venus]
MSFPKIDVHTHYLSPAYREALKKAGHFPGTDGLPFTADWTAEEHLAFMEKNNVAKVILSCSSPGTHLIPGDDEFGRKVTREMNEFAAELKRKYPAKFGFFASLPLPDIASSLLEIDYALDHLDADGFVFLSNYHGMYLGDPQLAPVYAKLQERRATVFVHPTTPCIARACNHTDPTPKRMLDSAPLVDAYMIPMIEYLFDSTRTFVDLLLTGTAAAHPDVTFVVPHCGAALPSVLDRVFTFSMLDMSAHGFRKVHTITAPVIKEMFAKQFYFDLAGSSMASQIHHILQWVKSDRLVYGSDVPWTPYVGAEKNLELIKAELLKLFGEEEIRNICEGNAARLLAKK